MNKNYIKWLKYEYNSILNERKISRNLAKGIYPPEGIIRIKRGECLSIEDLNVVLKNKILEGKPFWAGRMGGTEMQFIRYVLRHRFISCSDYRKEKLNNLCFYSGFFPEDLEKGEKFVDLMLDNAALIDLQGFWNLPMEDYLFEVYQKNTRYVTHLDCLEPWRLLLNEKTCIEPWTSALRHKRVLVVHPFAETIELQYSRREKIFEKIDKKELLLPEFELITLKAVQSLGGTKTPFGDWFEALEYMENECKKLSFDVAIVGCGAYGYPLAASLKQSGHVVIHLGGATQLLFGILGRRWENNRYRKILDSISNEWWVRPNNGETLDCSEKIEQACYW